MKETEYAINYPKDYVKPTLPGKAAWVAALRSGEYIQGKTALLDQDGCYCCLGVLSKLQNRLTAEGKDGGPFNSCVILEHDNPLHSELGSTGSFPEGVFIHGIDNLRCRRNFIELTSMNDSGYTFNQIADIIDSIWD